MVVSMRLRELSAFFVAGNRLTPNSGPVYQLWYQADVLMYRLGPSPDLKLTQGCNEDVA